jgi:hypothetical protein
MAPKLPSNFLVKLIVVISPQTDYILKLNVTGTNALTALPSLVNGANFHFLIASEAGLVNTGFPLTIFTFSTTPFWSPALNSTAPSIFNRFSGYGGYSEVLLKSSNPSADTFLGASGQDPNSWTSAANTLAPGESAGTKSPCRIHILNIAVNISKD